MLSHSIDGYNNDRLFTKNSISTKKVCNTCSFMYFSLSTSRKVLFTEFINLTQQPPICGADAGLKFHMMSLVLAFSPDSII
jgi:hypothetical protein